MARVPRRVEPTRSAILRSCPGEEVGDPRLNKGADPSIPDLRRPVIEHLRSEVGGQIDLGEVAEPLTASTCEVERVEGGLLGGRHALPIPLLEAAKEPGGQAMHRVRTGGRDNRIAPARRSSSGTAT